MAIAPKNPVNEFYKKGCQEKTSASTGGEISFSRSSPLKFRFSGEAWPIAHAHKVSSADGGDAIEFERAASQTAVQGSTMVLSEARGLWLFLVLRGGITCNG
jgi:hypothetical protein